MFVYVLVIVTIVLIWLGLFKLNSFFGFGMDGDHAIGIGIVSGIIIGIVSLLLLTRFCLGK